MDTNNFKETPYTIELDWLTGNVWLNIHTNQEKIVITKKDLSSIKNCFNIYDIKNKEVNKKETKTYGLKVGDKVIKSDGTKWLSGCDYATIKSIHCWAINTYRVENGDFEGRSYRAEELCKFEEEK